MPSTSRGERPAYLHGCLHVCCGWRIGQPHHAQALQRKPSVRLPTCLHTLTACRNFPQPNYTYDVYVTTSGAVRLVDFNPMGGTTTPLLFAWEELLPGATATAGLGAAVSAAAQIGQLGSQCQAAACQSCAPQQPGAVAAAATAAAAAASEAEPDDGPSYLKQLRRVQALSLEGQQQQQQQQEEQAGAASGLAGAAAELPASGGPAAAAAGSIAPEPSAAAFDFRIIEEAVAMRPHTLAYGVPFDFVDSSEGSALDRLMQQQQAAQQLEASCGGDGAGELWAALQQQAAGAGGGGAVN